MNWVGTLFHWWKARKWPSRSSVCTCRGNISQPVHHPGDFLVKIHLLTFGSHWPAHDFRQACVCGVAGTLTSWRVMEHSWANTTRKTKHWSNQQPQAWNTHQARYRLLTEEMLSPQQFGGRTRQWFPNSFTSVVLCPTPTRQSQRKMQI